MYLYTDIIEPQPHPDTYVQILRTIAVEETPDRLYKCLPFQKVYYMALQKHYINSISFQILDDTEKKWGLTTEKLSLYCISARKNEPACERVNAINSAVR